MNGEQIAKQPDSLSRRTFIAGAGAAVAGGVLAASIPGKAHADEPADEGQASSRVFEGQELSIGRVVHDSSVCSGCRTCEIVCSVYHEGVASSELSRLKWRKGVMDACITEIYNCKQCAGAECVASCPSGALGVDPETGARVISAAKCVGCQVCMSACPVNPPMIKFNQEKNVCIKCDLCGGEPQCVKFCPMGALAASWAELQAVEEGQSLYELNITGDARPWTHCEFPTLVLTETGSGLQLDGVVWTSHATLFNVIACPFTVTADFYDASGTQIGSSDAPATGEIPEMSSFEFSLTCSAVNSASKVGKIVININGDVVTNAPETEA